MAEKVLKVRGQGHELTVMWRCGVEARLFMVWFWRGRVSGPEVLFRDLRRDEIRGWCCSNMWNLWQRYVPL